MRGRRVRTVLGLAAVLAVIAAITVGSFAASGSWTTEPSADNPGTSVEWKREPSLVGGLQQFSSYQDLKQFLDTTPPYLGWMYWGSVRGGLLNEATLGYAADDSPDYSKTNIQVEGVDEADIVKSDGEYIYLATDNRVNIAMARPPEKARILCALEFEGNIRGLFVNGDRLAVLVGSWMVNRAGSEDGLYGHYYHADKTAISVYDVTDREEPVLEREVSVDGYYVSSRMIGDYVYLIASGSAWVVEDNITLPRISGDNGTIEIQPVEIWHSATPDNGYGFTTIMSVSIANDDEEPVHETLLMGSSSSLYVSPSNIYVTFPDWSGGTGETSIHRIHIDEGQIEYHATGQVPGWLLNQFSMDEHGEYFRVATTRGWSRATGSTNNVYVLDQNLDIYGRLENLAPGEQIFSARFMGNRCYLVTFEVIDPLFVIDLSSPGNPRVLGELKIPGYSGYLHPFDENHLIGIGMLDSTVKIALFDVTDAGNPKEISTYAVSNDSTGSQPGWRWSSTPVLQDHKAFLFDRDRGIMVLPVTIYGEVYAAAGLAGSAWQGAYVFDVSLERGLELRGKITHCDSEESEESLYGGYYGYSSCSIERSLYIGDVLYTISRGKIGMNDLETLREIGEISLD